MPLERVAVPQPGPQPSPGKPGQSCPVPSTGKSQEQPLHLAVEACELHVPVEGVTAPLAEGRGDAKKLQVNPRMTPEITPLCLESR